MKNNLIFFIAYLCILLNINLSAQTTTVSGSILTASQEIATNVNLTLSGDGFSQTVAVDELGNYEFTDVPINLSLTIVGSKDDNFLNGVSTFDLVMTSRHILGVATFETADQYIAMDVNQSGSITAFDMIQLRRLILGITQELPNSTAWQIIATERLIRVNDPNGDNDDLLPISPFTTTTDPHIINFTAIKIGDANGNAIP